MPPRSKKPLKPLKPVATVEIIDATTALDWLDTQVKNRPVSKPAVASYQRDMRNGLWELNGESIKFDCNGALIDGQHRLLALAGTIGDVDSVLIEVMVVRGLVPEAQRSVDGGRRRDAGQQLAMRGVASSFNLASIIRYYTLLQDPGGLFNEVAVRSKMSNLAIEVWVDEHPEEVEFINAHIHNLRKIETRAGISGAMLLIFAEVNREAALEFFEGMYTGANLAPLSPILTLRNRFTTARRTKEKMSDKDIVGFYIQAWNWWRKGDGLDKTHRPRDGWVPRHYQIRK